MRNNSGRLAIPDDFGVSLNDFPTECPYCHKSISPIFHYVHKRDDAKTNEINVIFSCPGGECSRAFVAAYVPPYAGYSNYNFAGIKRPIYGPHEVPKRLKIFDRFSVIYLQAQQADAMGLSQISGSGYRKALEVLIKDFCIQKNPDKTDEIIKSNLGFVIENYVKDESLKIASKRAAWLGNDETHYLQKWEKSELISIKSLLELTMNWIEHVLMTEELLKQMPEPK